MERRINLRLMESDAKLLMQMCNMLTDKTIRDIYENYINEYLRYRGYITWETINDILGVTPRIDDLNNISVYKYTGKILRLDVKQITFDPPSYEISFREE